MTRNPCLCRAWIASFSSRTPKLPHEMDLWNKNLPAHYNSVDHIPVESIRSARLIYRSIVIHRHQLYIIDPEIFQIRKSCRMFSISIQRSIFATKCRIFPSYLYWKSAGCIPGKLFDMQLIDYLLCFFFPALYLIPTSQDPVFLKSTAILRRPFTPQAFA